MSLISWRASWLRKKPSKNYILLLSALIIYVLRFVYQLVGPRLDDPAAYGKVNPFFGPGVYLAWWTTAVSVVVREAFDVPSGLIACAQTSTENPSQVSLDFLTTMVYIGAVAINIGIKAVRHDYAELEACLVVLEAGADLSLASVFITAEHTFETFVAIGSLLFSIMTLYSPDNGTDTSSGTIVGTTVIVGLLFWLIQHAPNSLSIEPKIFKARILIPLLFTLWLFGGRLGSYLFIPKSEVDLASLDQVVPFVTAVLMVVVSWRGQLRILVKLFADLRNWRRSF